MGKPIIQRYSPDTCGCVIVMVKDDRSDPNEEFRHVEGSVLDSQGNRVEGLVACPDHAMLSRRAIFECVLADDDSENKRKNQVIKELMEDTTIGLAEEVESDDLELEDHPVLGQVPKLDAQGQQVRQRQKQFKKGVDVRWRFTGTGDARQLEAWVIGTRVTPPMRAKLDACAARCGTARRPVAVRAQLEG